MLAYFSLTLFVSATLLFLVQPMIGKMILPQLGGTPAVWNTCMVFFQGVLLVGYGYTHLLTTTQPTRRQVLIQGALLFSPFLLFMLPFSLGNWEPPTEDNPIFALLLKLVIMVGVPFFMVSTTAPLLQKWFFHTGHPASKDPYFLYGASNLGSMLGLLLYPSVVEPWLQVTPGIDEATWKTQVHLWSAGYAIFVGMVVGCAVIVWQALAKVVIPEPAATPPAPVPVTTTPATAIAPGGPKRRGARIDVGATKTPTAPPATINKADQQDNITLLRRLRWIGLAAAPSSLMLGVTTYMTTDIAPVAFFWIIPLAMYLLTFILVFSRWPWVWTGTPHTVVLFVQPCALLFLVLKMTANITAPKHDELITFALHLGAFFFTTLMCHGELAKDRPTSKHLTEFYFWMSLGGVLGGLFNALFAPIAFQYGIWEYMVALSIACLMRSNLTDQPKTLIPGDSTAEKSTRIGYALDFGVPIVIGILGYLAVYYTDHHASVFFRRSYLFAVLVVLVLALSLRPVRFGLSVAALFIAVTAYDHVNDPALYQGRGFFGLLRVRETPVETKAEINQAWTAFYRPPDSPGTYYEWKVYRTLIHGGINHGRQIVRFRTGYKTKDGVDDENDEDPAMNLLKRREPITYFHPRNGVAELFYKLAWKDAEPVSALTNMTGKSDARLPASMVGLAFGDSPLLAMLGNTQSEPPYAVIGLGTGILASYAKPYQHMDIYEIDPLVKGLSVPAGYVPPWHEDRAKMPKDLPDPTFYYVYDAQERWANINIKLGDGRLKIKKAPRNYYHVIVVDAFSSDAIPMHLLTRDAINVYLDKLADGGVLLFNTTNKFVRLEGVLAAIAKDLDLDCLQCGDWGHGEKYPHYTDHPDRFSADWVVLQRKPNENGTYHNGGRPIGERLERTRDRLAWNGIPVVNADDKKIVEERWQEIRPLPGPVWTDGYSNMLNPRVMPWLTGWLK